MNVSGYFGTGKLDKNKEVGIEIEMEGRNLVNYDMNYWKCEGDGSLRGESIEWVLKSPVNRNRVVSRIKYLIETMKAQKAVLRPSDRCGVHIHVNCQTLDFEQLFRFISLYAVFEDVLTNWCGDDREGNLFCLRMKDASHLLSMLAACKKEGDIYAVCNDHYRYGALNLAALAKYGSLEFRQMRTPDNLMEIDVWADALMRIFDYAKDNSNEHDYIQAVSMRGGLAFAKDVLGDMVKVFVNNKNAHLIMDGARRAQFLVNIPLADSLKDNKEDRKKKRPQVNRFGGGRIVLDNGHGRQHVEPVDNLAINWIANEIREEYGGDIEFGGDFNVNLGDAPLPVPRPGR